MWDAGLVLAGYINSWPRTHVDQLTTIDLGAGTGIAGLSLARMGARVFLVDLPACLPLLRHNAELNSLQVEVMPLRWGDKTHIEDVRRQTSPKVDLILASDLFAWPDLFDDLLATVVALSSLSTTILLSYEERNPPAESVFFKKLYMAGFELDEVPTESLDPEYRSSEIHIFRARLRPRL